ncbi:transposase [Sporosarcina sp. G11-34]|uniref:transposase n=1 Tax=Sporosarcina sp. G11-34 TaxID=2849605 RepID=UPI0022A98B92|nr:transposase [Sporosarcina sp. G11-34]MCZ2260714.1 transposase [Sporosarcina sp. G11-34]
MSKHKMYVSVVNQKVYSRPEDSLWEYEVEVPQEYVKIFNGLFKQTEELEWRNFLRAHLPFIPYHNDRDNHEIDLRTQKVYALIHEFTDTESKRFIEELPYFR